MMLTFIVFKLIPVKIKIQPDTS